MTDKPSSSEVDDNSELPDKSSSTAPGNDHEFSSAKELEEGKRRESTDAAVETGKVIAEENADIAELTRDMFEKITAYLQGDLAATAEDYKLLEQMNLVTAKKYADMRNIALQIGDSMTGLQSKYQSLQPYLDQIDQVEESVTSLEQAALRLDAYSKRLEAKFKQLEKR